MVGLVATSSFAAAAAADLATDDDVEKATTGWRMTGRGGQLRTERSDLAWAHVARRCSMTSIFNFDFDRVRVCTTKLCLVLTSTFCFETTGN
jgi:hypothetical protein